MTEPKISKEERKKIKKALKEIKQGNEKEKWTPKFQPITGGLIPSAEDKVRWLERTTEERLKKIEENIENIKARLYKLEKERESEQKK